MGKSLLEQMKKTGLVDKSQAQKAKHSQYKNKKQKTKKGSGKPVDEISLLAQKTQAEKVKRDRQSNQQLQEETERKAIAAQIIQLIETNRVEDREGEHVYNFTDANVVKHINVSEQIYKHLMSNHLAIAKLNDRYELVPMIVAEKIKQRDTSCIISSKQMKELEHDEDDPYADYQIPDDLMW